MIVRYFIQCETCDHSHTLRIQVGHGPTQEHTFHCYKCDEEMILRMDCDPNTLSIHIKEIHNCVAGSEEGTIVNLSPDFIFPKEDLHKDRVFQSIEYTEAIRKIHDEQGINAPLFSSYEELRTWASNQKTENELWPIVKKGWSLTNKGNLVLARKILKKYCEGNFSDPPELQFVLFNFCVQMLIKKYYLFSDAAAQCQEIGKNHRDEFQRFRNYFKSEMAIGNFDRYFETFKEFFSCFSEFSQTLRYIQCGIEPPNDYESSSYAFSKTKLFYGNAYETLTSNVAVLACLNNIGNGRKYDQFETMDLKKYLTINKANRCNPFKDIPQFQAICACLDSTIRNASHHGGMKLINNGKVIQYRSGGDGKLRTMSYSNYLNRCNNIMLSCCALLALELLIAF